jgi:uncharacterized protein involved in outer membrane biogenesis
LAEPPDERPALGPDPDGASDSGSNRGILQDSTVDPGSGPGASHPYRERGRRILSNRWFRALAVVLALVALWGVVLGLVMPGVLRNMVVDQLVQLTGRPVSVERVEIEPYALVVRLLDLRIGEPAAEGGQAGDGSRSHQGGQPSSGAQTSGGAETSGGGQTPARGQSDAHGQGALGKGEPPPRSRLRLARVEADLSWRSLRHLAPMVERLRIEQPALLVVRNAEGIYDGEDIVERLQERASDDDESEKSRARFSLANLELVGGSARLDDRLLGVQHAATDIGLRVPFVSSLPVHEGLFVEPALELRLDGAPIYLDGRVLPFAEERLAEFDISLERLDLTRVAPHLPANLPFKLAEGALSTEASGSFVAPPDAPPRLQVKAWAALEDLNLLQPDERPVLVLPRLEARAIELEPLALRFAVGELLASGPRITVERGADEAGYFEAVTKALAASKDGHRAERSSSAPALSAWAPSTRPSPTSAPSVPQSPPPVSWSIGSLRIEQGRLVFDDRAFEPRPLELTVDEIALAASGLGSGPKQVSRLTLSGRANGGETLSAEAQLQLEPFTARGEASIESLPLAHWAWLTGPSLRLEVHEGLGSIASRFELSLPPDGAPLDWTLSEGRLEVERLALAREGREVLELASLGIGPIGADPERRRIAVGSIQIDGARLALVRDAQGRLDAASWWGREAGQDHKADGGEEPSPKHKADGGEGGQPSSEPWRLSLERLALANSALKLEHASQAGVQPEPLRLSAIRLEATGLASDGGAASPVSLDAEVGEGRIELRGTVVPTSGEAAMQVLARRLPVDAAQPWIPPQVNARITSGTLSADGKFELRFGEDGEVQGGWRGAVAVTDFDARLAGAESARPGAPASERSQAEAASSEAEIPAAVAREAVAPGAGVSGAVPGASATTRSGRRAARARELVRWDALELAALRVDFSPLFIDTGEVVLDGLAARLVITPAGRFNLQDIVEGSPSESESPLDEAASAHAPTGPQAGEKPSARPGESAGEQSSTTEEATAGEQASALADAPPGEQSFASGSPPVAIGPVTMTDGNIDFSDFFIDPNYSANLTGVSGTIGAMRAGHPGEIELQGRIDNTGALEITGRIEPIGAPLFLDVQADASDIDLPALSPYSAKYVGYGIEKGKLSATVEYRVENRQLVASNRIVLDELRFGEKVESPDALQLPVLFAVSLLKDRNGVIDVELPISGSLDDPQFSVGSIVTRLIGNLIARAVTAPFALIANLVGASEAELSQLPFAPGEAALGEEARERLAALAKALLERPGLELEIGGRAVAEDRESLRRAAFEARLRRMKGDSGNARTGGGARVEGEERERLILAAWMAAQRDKPGDRQPGEGERPSLQAMEAQLVASTRLSDSALLDLASRRARAAKDRLADAHKVEAARLFVTAPRLLEEKAEGPIPGVEMSLK